MINILDIVPYFQPKIDLKTLIVCGAEVYLTALHINKTILRYPDLQKIFSQYGLLQLDFILLEKAFEFISQFNSINSNLKYSFNLPLCNTEELNGYFNHVHYLLENYPNVNKDQLEFELLEEYELDQDKLKIFKTLSEDFGFNFSMDDFGIANSNLERLFYCQDIIQVIKLDRFLITRLDNHLIINFFNFISKVAKDLNFKVLAEGVETLDQLLFLKNNNISYAQGFYFYKSMPPFSFFKIIPNYKLQNKLSIKII